MNFPKLQMLSEAKKKAKADDMEMDFEVGKSIGDMDDAPAGKKAKGAEAPAVDKAAVLAYLKSCDAKCRSDVKKKLDKMVAADEAAA